jgi:DNA-directed RNA polymerase subunit omega
MMEGFFATDCDLYIPNRFATVHLAALRARELWHGSPARIRPNAYPAASLALREIAAGAFTLDEIVSYLAAPRRDEDWALPALAAPSEDVLRDGAMRDAAALASRSEELVGPQLGKIKEQQNA